MQNFVELWVYLSATPLFGLTATVVTYVLAQSIYTRVDQAPWANPVLWTASCWDQQWSRWLGRCGSDGRSCGAVPSRWLALDWSVVPQRQRV